MGVHIGNDHHHKCRCHNYDDPEANIIRVTKGDTVDLQVPIEIWDDEEDEFYHSTVKTLLGDLSSKDLTGIAIVLGIKIYSIIILI